jgi:dephospho-CoA kinase
MLKLGKVAVTGSLACGKSSVCQIFEKFGAFVISADQIVHELLSSDQDVQKGVRELLGDGVFDGEVLNRQKVADKVFTNPNLLEELEHLLHPAVFERIEQQCQGKDHPLIIVEIPLLFETNSELNFDATVAVYSRKEACIERLGGDEDKFNRRSKRQLSAEEKAERADYVIENHGTLADLEAKVDKLYHQLTG